MKLVFILVALTFFKAVLVYKVYHSLPELEIKRRARANQGRYAALHKVAAYGPSVDLLVWLAGTASAAVLLIWAARTAWWLAALSVIAGAWLVVWARFPAAGWAGRLAGITAPAMARVLSLLQPLLGPIAGWLKISGGSSHTGLYEKRDVLEFIKRQNKQGDNRVPEHDLLIAFNAMQFGDKQVGQIMTPRRQVKLVKADELAGPVLTDELHKTGFSRFPVTADSPKAANPKIIGTLYLSRLIGHEGNAKVKDLTDKEVYFINEDSNLRQALNAFLKTHHHLLIVVNSFEEMVGVLSLEDVLEQILGKQIIDEFDNYENLRAVAAQDAKAEHAEPKEAQPGPPPKEPEPVSP